MAIIRLKGLIVSVLLVLFFTTIPMATLVSVTTLILTGTHLSSFAIFTLLLGFAILRETFCYNLSLSMQIASDGKVALDRIQTFLMEKVSKSKGNGGGNNQNQNLKANLAEQNVEVETKNKMDVQLLIYIQRDDDYLSETRSGISNSPSEAFNGRVTPEFFSTHSVLKEPFVTITEASSSWNQDILGNTLRDITFNVRNGNLFAMTGAVGSGKSSLLTAILGELPLHRGSVSYHGKIAYVPQIPWVFSGTIRENILFGLPFNEERFQQVVHICELTKDLTNFTNGDLTEIGQRGVTLSGGQKARVGLARAVYSDADIYLLDDPLSAVDTKVGRTLFESCILNHLSGRIRLLVTHQLQYLKDVDRVIVMDNGSITHQGVYAEILDQGAFKGVAGLSEDCEDGPGLPDSVSLDGIDDKSAIKRELQGPSDPSIDTCDMPRENAQRQTLEQQTLAELIQDDKGISDTLQRFIVRFAEGKDNAAFEEDHEAYESILLEKEKVGQELSELLKTESGLDVILDEFNEKMMIKKVLNEPSVSFVGGPSEGQDNEAFVDNLTSPKQTNDGVGVNVKEETIPQTAGSLVLANMRDASEADPLEPSVLDLKEDEEDKSAGTVTFRLYWNYFKQGLPVSRILILAVALLFAQGKAGLPRNTAISLPLSTM